MMSRTALAVALVVVATASHAADTRRAPFSQAWVAAADFEVAAGIFHDRSGKNFDVFSTTGRANVPFQGTLNLQLQTTANTLFVGGGASTSWMDAYAHVWHRLPSSAWGVFGGAEFSGATFSSLGVEAKHYLGNVSIGGDTAYMWQSITSTHAWEVSANADLYVTPNHRIGLGAQYIKGFATTNIWDVRVDAEGRLGGSPWSIWGWAAHFNSSGASSWAVLAGFRWYIDTPNSTLLSHGKDVPFYYQSIVPFL
jgi:hypothetical protein